MLNFTQDIKKAGLIFEEYGYKINALPKSYGKFNQGVFTFTTHLTNFPAKNLNDNCSIILNHYLSETIAFDVDDYTITKKILFDFNIDLDSLMNNTMTWQGQDNHYKLLYRNTNPKIIKDSCSLHPSDEFDIFSFKGMIMSIPLTKDNLNNYYDHLPPSYHPVIKRPYKFISRLYSRNELPEMPIELMDIWNRFDEYKPLLISKLY